MQQVPPDYAILGTGKLGKHLAHYFTLSNIPHSLLSARIPPRDIHQSTVLLCIPDSQIEPYITTHSSLLASKSLIHFSGSLSTPLAHSCHPLSSFSSELYPLETYQAIHFVSDSPNPLFPELLNPHHYLPPHLKPKYHALCVLANNFTTLLWQKLHSELNSLNLPQSSLQPFISQTLQNLLHNPQSALTGPLQRGDLPTINANLQALENDPFQEVYQAFLNAYQNTHHDSHPTTQEKAQ